MATQPSLGIRSNPKPLPLRIVKSLSVRTVPSALRMTILPVKVGSLITRLSKEMLRNTLPKGIPAL
jgi:hypothetical protein